MRQLLVVLALFCAAQSAALAQIQVSAQTERTNYMIYERLDLLVTVINISDTDILLGNNEGHPWLSFIVSKHNHIPVRPERKGEFDALPLKAGESKTLRVNITPLFSFRNQGDFTASAVIDLPGQGQMVSAPVPFSIVEGRKVWKQVHSADGSQRTYTLLRFSPLPDSTKLYLRVEDQDQNIVYANYYLGEIASYIDPEVFFDPKDCLHIMQPISLGTYLYTRTDADGKVLDQRIFKSIQQVPPRLAKLDDGTVTVIGGLAQDPNHPREKLSDTQPMQKADAQTTPAAMQ